MFYSKIADFRRRHSRRSNLRCSEPVHVLLVRNFKNTPILQDYAAISGFLGKNPSQYLSTPTSDSIRTSIPITDADTRNQYTTGYDALEQFCRDYQSVWRNGSSVMRRTDPPKIRRFGSLFRGEKAPFPNSFPKNFPPESKNEKRNVPGIGR